MRNSLDRIGSETAIQQEVSGERGEDDSEAAQEKTDVWDIFDDTDFYHQILRDVVDARKDGNG